MKTFLFIIAFSFMFILNEIQGQCGRFSLIGEFNGWTEDEFLTRDLSDPDEFSLFLYLDINDDIDQNGFVEMKFRENSDWNHAYGSTLFPSGTAVLDGPNIPVPVGSYLVTFNCESKQYNFESVCGIISLIGEFNGWAGDVNLERDPGSNVLWTGIISLDTNSNQYGQPDIIEMKFRENADWMNNWGNTNFPSGTGMLNGPNIPVPLTSTGTTTDYKVSFNCVTGAYNFLETCGPISIIGEFGGWVDDLFMERDETNPNLFRIILTLTTDDDTNMDHIVEMKFRENAEWILHWGSTQFPSGTGAFEGPNIPVPLDNIYTTTDYMVTFNYTTLAYHFEAISGDISIIGAFNGWIADIPMNRNLQSPNNWNLIRRWTEDSDIKFRENENWAVNWGDDAWPAGYGTLNGPNIPLLTGTYNVAFNAVSGEYSFVNNPDACGEIGLVGDFNEWGGTGDTPTDAWMVRDPVYPSLFSLDYTFSESTTLLFRLDADETFANAWGGTSLCQTGVQNASLLIPVGGASYHITFDFNSKDYCITHLGNSVEAPKVFDIVVDGFLDESPWDVTTPVNKLIQGDYTIDPNEVFFSILYDDDFLYVGLKRYDNFLYINDNNEFFVDGNNSGGEYDDHDLHFVTEGAQIEIITGPPGIIIESALQLQNDGYTLELAIPLETLGITPAEGSIIGFDIISWDDDNGSVDYKLAWNGTINNFLTTSDFGDVIFGSEEYGDNITMYNYYLGDIALRQLSNNLIEYVATYEFDDDFGVVFRMDRSNSLMWGGTDFPEGNADLGGPPIPALTGRYRISFNSVFETYSFAEAPPGENVAMTYYTEDFPVIDGELDEYELEYGSEIIANGAGPNNNVVQWGSRWDFENLYIGVRVMDAAVFGAGNPWDNDGIEFFIDGNNDKDGLYDLDFDTQIIMDYYNESEPWFKADGVEITNYEAKWQNTGLGYNVEIRLGWDNFNFDPGRGRVIGWSLGNNDNDNDVGRDYQTVWYGNGNNWNNTSYFGDLQMAEGPYTKIPEMENRPKMTIFPNPSGGNVTLLLTNLNPGEHLTLSVVDLSGRPVYKDFNMSDCPGEWISLDLNDLKPGIYLIRIITDDGICFLEKLVIQ